MDTRLDSHLQRRLSQPTTPSVRLLVWGLTDVDIERAIESAGWGKFRQGWTFVSIARLKVLSCPLNLEDPATIATGEGSHWAYAVYPAGAVS